MVDCDILLMVTYFSLSFEVMEDFKSLRNVCKRKNQLAVRNAETDSPLQKSKIGIASGRLPGGTAPGRLPGMEGYMKGMVRNEKNQGDVQRTRNALVRYNVLFGADTEYRHQRLGEQRFFQRLSCAAVQSVYLRALCGLRFRSRVVGSLPGQHGHAAAVRASAGGKIRLA